MENNKLMENKHITWDDFVDTEIERDFLPAVGEGDNMMSQAITAGTKLIYRWFNDGDVFDSHCQLPGWLNDLSSYANWLYKYIPEVKNILDGIYDVKNENDYINLLYSLWKTLYTKEIADKYSGKQKTGTVYDCDGPFEFVESEEDEDPWYSDEDYDEDEENINESFDNLNEDTHAQYAKPEGNRVASFNNALRYAKKDNKPFIYGYTGKDGKFFALEQPIKCADLDKETKDFKNKYKNCKVVDVAYPDKEFVEESLQEDYSFGSEINELLKELNYYATHDDPINMDLLNSALAEEVEKPEEKDVSEWEKRKQRILEYYNKVKEWDKENALNKTSCKFNVGVDQLNEWIEGENKND